MGDLTASSTAVELVAWMEDESALEPVAKKGVSEVDELVAYLVLYLAGRKGTFEVDSMASQKVIEWAAYLVVV